MTSEAILPYGSAEGRNSGWSGSDASRERAEERDSSGKTGRLQARVREAVGAYGISGTTIKRLREVFPSEHHGTLSGALTALHKGGKIARLTEKRDKCSIYVLPEFVNGRETVMPGRQQRTEAVLVWRERAHRAEQRLAAARALADRAEATPSARYIHPSRLRAVLDAPQSEAGEDR